MILFNKKAVLLIPVYLLYIILILCFVTLADADILIQAFTDKVFVYLIVPPFACGTSLIEESMKKTLLVRMKDRKQAVSFLLIQQYLFGIIYLVVWFMLIAGFANAYGENIENFNFLGRFLRYLLCFFLFVNVAGCFKRSNKKLLASVPFVAAYVILILDVLAITSITGKELSIVYILFSWTFYGKNMLGIVMLAVFLIGSYRLLNHLDQQADFY